MNKEIIRLYRFREKEPGAGAICARIHFPYMDRLGVCSTFPILVKKNPKYGVPKIKEAQILNFGSLKIDFSVE